MVADLCYTYVLHRTGQDDVCLCLGRMKGYNMAYLAFCDFARCSPRAGLPIFQRSLWGVKVWRS